MSPRSLHRLFRGHQAVPTKVAVPAILILVGLCVWGPSFVRTGPDQHRPPVSVEIDAPLPDVEVEARVSNAPTESRHAILKSPNPGNTLTYDPLVRLVEVAAIQGGPFRIDQQQFPSPLLFESEDLSETTVQLSATSAPAPDGGTPHGMVLRSTILGVKQRAALINARLCFEGSEFHVNGERYLLRSVYPRKVVLFRGTELIELAIPAEIAGDSSTSAREPRKLPTDNTWDD